MQVKPLNDRVLVKPIEEAQATKTGILLPSTAEKKKEKGEVVAVGPGRMLDNGTLAPMNVKPGDKVMYKSAWGEDTFKDEGTEYTIISESDILAVIS